MWKRIRPQKRYDNTNKNRGPPTKARVTRAERAREADASLLLGTALVPAQRGMAFTPSGSRVIQSGRK